VFLTEPSLRRRFDVWDPGAGEFGVPLKSLLLFALLLPSGLVDLSAFLAIPDRRGGKGSEDRRMLRALLTPEGGGLVTAAVIALRPKSEKDMMQWRT